MLANRLRRRVALGDESGFTLIELTVGGMLATLLLGALGTFLMGSFEAGVFTQGQSATINDVRNAMQKVEKEARGAELIVFGRQLNSDGTVDPCTPVGSCLFLRAQKPNGGIRVVRYTHAGTQLVREERPDPNGTTWGAPLTIIERVANSPTQPVFTCHSASTYLHVTVDLHIEPTPQSRPYLNVQTSIRPRNYPKTATC